MSLMEFLGESAWGSVEERERHRRIKVTLFAYAYEFENESLISDAEYDALSREINPQISTGHKRLDDFFKRLFSPDTGMWIRQHPEIVKVRAMYHRVRKYYAKAGEKGNGPTH